MWFDIAKEAETNVVSKWSKQQLWEQNIGLSFMVSVSCNAGMFCKSF